MLFRDGRSQVLGSQTGSESRAIPPSGEHCAPQALHLLPVVSPTPGFTRCRWLATVALGFANGLSGCPFSLAWRPCLSVFPIPFFCTPNSISQRTIYLSYAIRTYSVFVLSTEQTSCISGVRGVLQLFNTSLFQPILVRLHLEDEGGH